MITTLIRGRTYTNDVTDLKLYVIKKSYEDAKRVKIRGTLFNRYNGISYETKNYTIWKDKLKESNWKVVREDL